MATKPLTMIEPPGRLPGEKDFDCTVPLLFTEGYQFVSNRARQHGTDIFAARILLRDAICIFGREAAEHFYSPGRFTRRGALPGFDAYSVPDPGCGTALDDEERQPREALHREILSPASIQRIGELTAAHWKAGAASWQHRERVVLAHEAPIPLAAAFCQWAGLDPKPWEVRRRAREFAAMLEGTGSIGVRNWRGHWMRGSSESWAREIIRKVRRGALVVPEESPARRISSFRDSRDKLLGVQSAAIELLNVLLPSAAIARYAVFIAMAMEEHPEWLEQFRGTNEELNNFVDEVRRYYPFIPFADGRVLEEFHWRGHDFKPGEWVIFDIYGTNHDPRIWGDPEKFRPARFCGLRHGPCDLVSHGVSGRNLTHRCPGEALIVEQMKAITRCLILDMDYDVPDQDLTIDLSRIPALPGSGFVMTHVIPRGA